MESEMFFFSLQEPEIESNYLSLNVTITEITQLISHFPIHFSNGFHLN